MLLVWVKGAGYSLGSSEFLTKAGADRQVGDRARSAGGNKGRVVYARDLHFSQSRPMAAAGINPHNKGLATGT